MSSEPSHPVCDIPSMSSLLEDNHTLTIPTVTSSHPLYSHIFHCNEDILEELTTPNWPWNEYRYITEHCDTWPDVGLIRQKQHPLHPSKDAAIKDEIDKLRIDGFIYPILYTSWVSNPVAINKK
jgi:hypothetical protein